MIKRIGSKYGGWYIDPNIVPQNSYIISAGLGNDISFDLAMIKLTNCFVVGIDPTTLAAKTVSKIKEPKFVYIKRGLFPNDNGMTMSNLMTNGNSIYSCGRMTTKFHTISIPTLIKMYKNISVLKMNIEGAEYPVLMHLPEIDIKQVCIRFHHRKKTVPYNLKNTEKCILKLVRMGYEVMETNAGNKNVDYEVLLCKK